MRKRKMEQELNHPHFVGVRLSDIELELLDRKAETLVVSRSECLRKLLVEKEIVHRVEVVADMEELRNLVRAYGKIGVNLNQIARYFNKGGERSLAMEDEIRQCITELFALREEVLKMAGGLNGIIGAVKVVQMNCSKMIPKRDHISLSCTRYWQDGRKVECLCQE